MTPTLFGRLQTRILLFATVGILLTLPFRFGIIGSGANLAYYWILGYVAAFGLIWDVVYNYLQKFRWDRDWPAAFQLLAGIWEAIFVATAIKTFGLPGVPRNLPLPAFALHYSLVWIGIFTASQALMRILFPRWRFKGGQWL